MDDTSQPRRLKVGELAAATGVTVRALHHYDELGLLRPSGRTASRHRIYLQKDVERLQRIVSLRQLGLSLEQVAAILDDARGEPLAVLEAHIAMLDERIAEHQRLRRRLVAVADQVRASEDVSTAELLTTIQEMTMFEKHFTREQLDQLAARRQAVGETCIREVEQEWPRLIAAVREHMQRGTAPTDPAVQGLTRRWQALVEEFTGGDAGIADGVRSVYENEPAARQRTGLDPEIMAYVAEAGRHLPQ